MKKILIAVLFAAMSTPIVAQNKNSDFEVLSKEVVCASMSTVLEILKHPRVDEKPIWIGKEQDKSNLVLLLNAKTNSWTVIQYYRDFACVLGMGEQSEMFAPKR